MDKKILVKIKTMDNKVTDIQVEPQMTIQELKGFVSQKLQIPIEKQRLIYQGKLLDNCQTLQFYKINDGNVIHLAGQPIQEEPQEQIQQQQQSSDIGFDLEILSSILRTLRQTHYNRQNIRRMLYQQRGSGFTLNREQSLEGINQNYLTIKQLLDTRIDHKDTRIQDEYVNPFDITKREFKVGQWIDLKDTIDQWLEAQVLIVEQNTIFVHYNGWGRRWDEWVPKDSPRIATFRTYTVGSAHSDFMSPTPNNDPDADLQRQNIDLSELAINAGRVLENTASMLIEFGRLERIKKIQKQQLHIQQMNNGNLNQKIQEIKQIDKQSSVLSSQLAPLFDRVGRMMVDMAPHLAISGSQTQRTTHQQQQENQDNTSQYIFQVPITLTPNELQSLSSTTYSRLDIISSGLAILRMTELHPSQVDTDDDINLNNI